MKNRMIMSIAALVTVFTMSGCTMMKMGVAYMGFPTEAQEAYAAMMTQLGETGDPAQAMMKEWEITDPDITEEDVFDEMKSLAGEYNMRYVGEKDMFRLLDAEREAFEKSGIAKADQVVHARIGEFCSLIIAKKMFNHSRFYGGFMPCRVAYVEYGDGRRFLISMDMTLAIYGGTDKKPISEELLEDMVAVKKAMEEIPAIAAGHDVEEKE
ncbi:DUF302 domain-containing protein [Sulfurimonas sp.]|nr:DUF302 domain-containing protein [Sulfurimonas sp.]